MFLHEVKKKRYVVKYIWEYNFYYRLRRSLRWSCPWVMFSFSIHAPLVQKVSMAGGKVQMDPSWRAKITQNMGLVTVSLKQDLNCRSEHHSGPLLDFTAYPYCNSSSAYSSRHEPFITLVFQAQQINRLNNKKKKKHEQWIFIINNFVSDETLEMSTEKVVLW